MRHLFDLYRGINGTQFPYVSWQIFGSSLIPLAPPLDLAAMRAAAVLQCQHLTCNYMANNNWSISADNPTAQAMISEYMADEITVGEAACFGVSVKPAIGIEIVGVTQAIFDQAWIHQSNALCLFEGRDPKLGYIETRAIAIASRLIPGAYGQTGTK